jgi:hypothetical protein
MPINVKQMYECTDGRVFKTEKEALIYEASNKALDSIQKNINCFHVDRKLEQINQVKDAINTILKYKSTFKEFILELTNIENKFNENYTE